MPFEPSDYLRLEYQTCHQKVSAAVENLHKIELYVFLGIAATYAWLFGSFGETAADTGELVKSLWIPPVLCLLAWYRSTMQLRYIAKISEYLSMIEAQLVASLGADNCWEHIGWETWYEEHGPKTWNITYRVILWPGLLSATLFIAWFQIGVPGVTASDDPCSLEQQSPDCAQPDTEANQS
ncbi:hypothetical protein [Ruegeria jejuensis]|uniref:hypothetical protein n=1 Tax=Ruegeria jejuensis TaxID=3233338 RepID=UPI00355C74AB